MLDDRKYWGTKADVLRCKNRLMFLCGELMRAGVGVGHYLKEHKISSYAIYGIGDMGEWLIEWSIDDGILPLYGIDKKEKTYNGVEVIRPNENRTRVDLVIVTVTHRFSEIEKQIKLSADESFVSLEDVLEELYFKYILSPIPMRYYKDLIRITDDNAKKGQTAICFFAFNRPDKVEITLEAIARLEGIKETPIIIVQDNTKRYQSDKGVELVRDYINEFIKRHRELQIEYIQWKQNAGPFISLTQGMMYAFEKYDRVIRIEDDIEVRKEFLVFMNEAFDYYENDDRIFSISSYNPSYMCEGRDVFLSKCFCPWGAGFYRSRFKEIIWRRESSTIDGIDEKEFERIFPNSMYYYNRNKEGFCWEDVSEDLMIAYYTIMNNKYSVYSNYSFCRNVGFDSGVHGSAIKKVVSNRQYNSLLPKHYRFDSYLLKPEEENELIRSVQHSDLFG